MQIIDISLLKEHSRNKEFFDDIEGERGRNLLRV